MPLQIKSRCFSAVRKYCLKNINTMIFFVESIRSYSNFALFWYLFMIFGFCNPHLALPNGIQLVECFCFYVSNFRFSHYHELVSLLFIFIPYSSNALFPLFRLLPKSSIFISATITSSAPSF